MALNRILKCLIVAALVFAAPQLRAGGMQRGGAANPVTGNVNTIDFNNGTAMTGAASDSVLHSMIGVGSGSAGLLVVDGSVVTGPANNGASGWTGIITLGGGNSGSVFADMNFAEFGLWSGLTANSTQYTAQCHNQRLYWASSGTC